MKISAEISLYPLNQNFGTPILEFIRKLNDYKEIEVRSNSMSTQIFGDFDILTKILNTEVKKVFESDDTTVFVMKIVNKDLR